MGYFNIPSDIIFTNIFVLHKKKNVEASARANKSTGALCLRLPREQFLPLLKMFPDDEENIAQAALSSFEVAKSQAGRYQLVQPMVLFCSKFLISFNSVQPPIRKCIFCWSEI